MLTLNKGKLSIATSIAVLLTACGGGGGDGNGSGGSVGEAQGAYEGTSTSASTTKSIQFLVLDDDSFWAMYGTTNIEGFIQGQGASNNGSFSSNNAKDFGVIPALSFSLSSTYSKLNHTISGTASSASRTLSFTAGPISSSSLYVYDTPANINTITGAWTLTAAAGGTISLYISNAGGVGAVVNGCTLSGTIVPRSSRKNVFNLAITEGSAPCPNPGTTYSGISLGIPQNNGATKLSITYINAERTLGGAAFGVR